MSHRSAQGVVVEIASAVDGAEANTGVELGSKAVAIGGTGIAILGIEAGLDTYSDVDEEWGEDRRVWIAVNVGA